MAADGVGHELLDLDGRHAADAANVFPPLLQDGMRHIVPVAYAELVGVRGAHAVAAVIEDAAGQNGRRASELHATAYRVFGEPGLHSLEQLPRDDRPMSLLMDRPSIDYLADAKAVLEQMRKSAGAKTDAAANPAVDKPARPGADTTPVEILDQGANGAKLEIAGEDGTDRSFFFRHHADFLVDDPVSQRHRSADPDALAS